MKARIVFIMVVLFLLSGCGPTKYKTTTSTHDSYKKPKWIKGPSVRVDHATQKPSAEGYSDVFLRTLVADGRLVFHQLFVNFNGLEWVFFNEAYNVNGNKLEFIEINKDFRSLGITEIFAITFSEGYLEAATKTGINIRCIGKRGERAITLEPNYVECYLKKCRGLTSSQ
jgi:hypothetical protein